jgi:hypothetical protein
MKETNEMNETKETKKTIENLFVKHPVQALYLNINRLPRGIGKKLEEEPEEQLKTPLSPVDNCDSLENLKKD